MAQSATKLNEKFEKLSKILECNICLERMTDPKALQCTHAFCKNCLDNILQFRPDGSSVIVCPLRCAEQTFIAKDATTNNLQVPVQFRSLMEMLGDDTGDENNSKKKFKCGGEEDCCRDLTFYCLTCSRALCDPCKALHKHARERYIPIRFYQSELHPWCTKHNSISRFCCSQCTFACVYCKQRTCEEHAVQDLAPMAEQVIKYVRENEPDYSRESQKLVLIKSVTDDTLAVIKGKVSKEMENRKIRWLSTNIKKLDEQEQRILHNIDQLKNAHYDTYPSTGMKDLVKGRPNFDIVLNKEKIIQKLTDAAANQRVPQVKWSLSDYGRNDHVHPLGEVVENNLPGVTITDAYITNSIQDDVVVNSAREEDRTCVIRGVERLLQTNLKKEEKKEAKDDKGKDKKDEPIFKAVTTGTQRYRVEKKKKMVTTHIPCYAWTAGEPTSYESEVECEELIPYEESYGDIERMRDALDMLDRQKHQFLKRLAEAKVETILIELIKIRPKKIFDQRDDEGFCLMHWAAEFGCVKLLLYILQYDMCKIDVKTYRTQYTALQRAVFHNQCATMEILIAYGADLHGRSAHGSAIDIARNKNNKDVIKILIDAQKRKDVW